MLQFIGDNALSVLNPVMAACKAMTDAAHGVEGSTLVTTMARNGTDFGIRVSGLGDAWFTAPAEVPDGLYLPGLHAGGRQPRHRRQRHHRDGRHRRLRHGHRARPSSPSSAARRATRSTPRWRCTRSPWPSTRYFTIPALDFRGTPTGIDIRKVVELGIAPRINTGIAHRDAGVGQVGAGLVRPPMAIFEQALIAFAEKYKL